MGSNAEIDLSYNTEFTKEPDVVVDIFLLCEKGEEERGGEGRGKGGDNVQ